MWYYNLYIVNYFISFIGFALIKAEWVEMPQFSDNKKVYRTSVQLDRVYQFPHDKSEKEVSTRRSVRPSDLQSENKFTKITGIEKTDYQKEAQLLDVNNSTTSLTLDSFQEITTFPGIVTLAAQDQNFESEESNQDYYYADVGANDNGKQITTLSKTQKDTMYTTCANNIGQTAFSNISTLHNNDGMHNENESKTKTDKNFLYFLPIKLIKRVHLILKSQPTTLKGKIQFLKNFEKILLSEVESRLATTFSLLPNQNTYRSNRRRRSEHHEDDSMGFPSLEGTLIAISFLTFAVYLVRLIMMLFQNLNNNMVSPTVFLGRKKRSMDHLNEETMRILDYLNK